jgi:hypothetical protein
MRFKKFSVIMVPNFVIENPDLSSDAFYLYVMLKSITPTLSVVDIRCKDILEYIGWKTKVRLIKYITELTEHQLITVEYTNEKTKNPIYINIPVDNTTKFTMINIETINKIIELCSKVEVLTKKHNGGYKVTISNYKEASVRMGYLYQHKYNVERNEAIPVSYDEIAKLTGLNNQSISSINEMLTKHGILLKHLGYRTDGFVRTRNKYKFHQVKTQKPEKTDAGLAQRFY